MSIDVDVKLARKRFELDLQQSFGNSGLTGIFGPSGCGKTSLLRCIAGLESPEGEIVVNGQIWQSTSSKQWLEPSKRNIAYLFQEARLLPHLSVEDNIRFNIKLRGLTQPETLIDKVLDDCGLTDLRRQLPATISGGQRQRACLARAMLCEPELILMDEPLSALDAKSKRNMLRLIQTFKAKSKTPMLYVSHSIDEIAQLADQLLIMQDGKAVHLGPALETFSEHGELFEQEQLASVFEAKITDSDKENHLSKATMIDSSTTEPVSVWLGEQTLTIGQTVRLRVTARDVSISLVANTDQSILNVIPAMIKSIDQTRDGHSVRIGLSLGSNTLHALITRRSLHKLDLKTGQKIWAQIKALSIYD